MALPENAEVFDFEYTTELGKKYEGQFTVRCSLNMGQKHALELEKTRLLGNYPNPTDELAGIAVILANLRVKITDAPPWWTQSNGGYNIEDEDALVALYRKVQDAEFEWRNKLIEKAQKAKAQTEEKKEQA